MEARLVVTLVLRVAGVLFTWVGLIQALANLLASWRSFDPSYLGYFFAQTVRTPLVIVGMGVLLYVLARPLAGRICR